MKSYALIVLALVVACVSAFAPVAQQRTAFKPLAMSKMEPAQPKDQKAAAIAAFATAITPLVAHADDFEGVTTVVNAVDEGTVIGYGAGLVACVVSLAVGFAIGYGTLVKP